MSEWSATEYYRQSSLQAALAQEQLARLAAADSPQEANTFKFYQMEVALKPV
jgi:hypothetical protein